MLSRPARLLKVADELLLPCDPYSLSDVTARRRGCLVCSAGISGARPELSLERSVVAGACR